MAACKCNGSSILDQIMPKEFGNKEKFRPDETMRILGVEDEDTLKTMDETLRPIKTSKNKKWYTRHNLESHLRKLNPNYAE